MSIDTLIKIIPSIVAIISFLYGYFKDRENRKLKKQIDEKDERLQANLMYEKIKNKKEIFEDQLAELTSLDEEDGLKEVKKVFLKTINKYTSLYNEIEDFCTKIDDGVIKSEAYIKDTILPTLSSLAETQVEVYVRLNEFAEAYKLDKLKKPDYKAFDKYDKFLIKYNGGEGGHFWRKMKNSRRDNGFE